MRTRSSRTTEDLVELDFTRVERKSENSEGTREPEVLVTDTMDVPEGNGNPLGNGLGRARQTRPIGLRRCSKPPSTETRDCSTTNAIKLRLFPMSLADKAHQWEKSLPHGTITTWDECKKAFLAKFFSTGRTAKLRSEISSFIEEQ
ncbi:unnamed protein product [Microthlaspi erraticum]|uniref:Retrotransposon gag domain-containing protein n=1 Tax=Microthlaspi erraticum TaxID=1685480 RepID=A0A6D2HTE1_9BRAS|nr:unnamed protein product [Microthlaspi erraticum]